MSDEVRNLLASGYAPALEGPKLFSLDDVLLAVDPAPDAETERFVAEIYRDRGRAAEV
jgi:hypothetical protein